MNTRKVGIALLFLALSVVVISLFWKQHLFLSTILVFMAYLIQRMFPIKGAIIWYIFMSILGPIIEISIILLGKNPWTYAAPSVWGVPFWLFPFYGFAGVVLTILYQGIVDSKHALKR